MESQVVINILKRVLKSKGLNYGDLAQMLGISRDSVKRIFSQGTITLDRLIKICNHLEVDFHDLNLLMEIDHALKEFEFSTEQELFFAKNFPCLIFYRLIFTYDSIKDLARDYDLDENTITKILAELDELKLIEWLPGNEVKILGRQKFTSKDKPIFKAYSNRIKTVLREESYEGEGEDEILLGLSLSKRALEKYRTKFKILSEEMVREMEVERILNVESEVIGFSLIMRPFNSIYDELKGFKA